MRILRPLRCDLGAPIGGPDHLIGRIFDLFAFKEVISVLVTGKIDHLVVLRTQCTGDREQHGVTEAAARKQNGLVLGDLGRRAGRAHHEHFLAFLEQLTHSRRRSHLEDDHRQESLFLIDPRTGQSEALHHQAFAVNDGSGGLKVLQAVKLSRLKLSGLQRSLNDDIDDGRGQAFDLDDVCAELFVERGGEVVKDAVALLLRQGAA